MGPKYVGVWINYKVAFDWYLFIPNLICVLFYFNFFILSFFLIWCLIRLFVHSSFIFTFSVHTVNISDWWYLHTLDRKAWAFFSSFSPAFCTPFHFSATAASSTEKIVHSGDRTSNSVRYKYVMKSRKCDAGQYAVLSKAMFYLIHRKIRKNSLDFLYHKTMPVMMTQAR